MLGRCGWVAIAAAACLLLTNCAVDVERDGPGEPVDAEKIADAVPHEEPRSRYGNPESYEVFGKRYHTLNSSFGFQERGIASWYGKKFHGRKTSSGEIYDMYAMTAAHKHLPLPTYVKVTNLENGRTAILKVNDRGPFHDNRVIDLSYAAALKLGVAKKGTAFVEITAVNDGTRRLASAADQMDSSAEGNSILYLQIGAFNDRVNAQRLTERVSRYLRKNVWIREAGNGNRSLYRVQVGPIATVDLADQLVATLFDLGINEHHFVTN
jgi:rare lipoprotein A